ncbi:MAG: hypothetical protein JXA11_10585 [Phycisphaerae bacterium]|nr:hypothetical protein [Phycisphaerae bacterium]
MPSNSVELFLDDDLVASMTGLKRTLEKPTKCPKNPLITRTKPWEKRCLEIYGTVMFDEAMKKFRCWYLASGSPSGIPDVLEHPGTAEYPICYAESKDGLVWNKPLLSPPIGSYQKTNIVIAKGVAEGSSHGWCVFRESDESDPQRRYKGAGGAIFGTSPDGMHWTLHNWKPAVGKNDTSTSVVKWNGEYLAYVRHQMTVPEKGIQSRPGGPTWGGTMRGVGLCVSKDFNTWTPKELVFRTDEKDNYPWTQPYGLAVTAYGNQLIGIPWMLHLLEKDGNNTLGPVDMQLVVSRDGRNWKRVADRAVFLAPSRGKWDSKMVWPGTTMFVKDDKVHLYYSGKDSLHGDGWSNVAIGLATLPADRFVAVEPAGNDAGVLQTKPMTSKGTNLVVNAKVPSDGALRVELVDAKGNSLSGFAAAACRLNKRDSLRFDVVWGKEKNTIAEAMKHGPVAIRFHINKGAKLFAYEIRDEKN